MRFREWMQLTEDDQRTGCKLGLYPPIYDSLGQYPPLYNTPGCADFITYYYMQFGKKGLPSKKGIIRMTEPMHSVSGAAN